MKKAFSLFLTVLIFSCGGANIIETNPQSIKKTEQKIKSKKSESTSSSTTEIKNYVKIKDVKSSLEYIASDDLEGRNTGGKGIEKAAVFIEGIFKSHGVKPYFKTYRDSFKIKKINGYNVVGYIEGNDAKLKNEFVILGAHYDHIGYAKAVNGDAIANGANDDASGTVAVLEWAKHFSKFKNNKRSLLFTLYAAEEMGLKGSEHLAKRLKTEGLNLYTMINFEMIGVPRAKNEIAAYITGYEKSNMASKLNSYVNEDFVGFLAQAKAYNLFERSDNYPFYKEFKVPAQAISTFDFTNFDYYHHVDDEADKMDFTHMTNFINKMIPAIEGMVNSPTKDIKIKK